MNTNTSTIIPPSSQNPIDLNCDLGEGGKYDAELMKLITSCNIACGGHYGDSGTVSLAVDLAKQNQVNIGAHPSYPDKKHFGRKSLQLGLKDLMQSLKEQIMLVKSIAESKSARLRHIKPHGALYHVLIKDEKMAKAFLDMAIEIDDKLSIFAPPTSIIHQLAENRLKTYREGFADRTYDSNYNLLSRQQANSLLTHPKEVEKQVMSILRDGRIPLANGQYISCTFDTLCIHGDNPKALEILKHLRHVLDQKHIQVIPL